MSNRLRRILRVRTHSMPPVAAVRPSALTAFGPGPRHQRGLATRIVVLAGAGGLVLGTWAEAAGADVGRVAQVAGVAKVATVASVSQVEKAKAKSHSSTTTTTTTTASSSGSTTTPPPTQADIWLIRAIGAEQNVGSVRIKGTLLQGKTPIHLNLLVNGDGEGGGTFVQDGSTIQLKRVGTLLYFNAPVKFWEAHSSSPDAKRYGGKWLEVSALDTRFASFDQFLNAGDLVSAVFYGHTNPLTLSKPTTYQGHKVVIVGDTVTVDGKKTSGKMYILATGRPYVVQIVDKGPTESGTLTFSHYGKPVSIVTPPEPINLSG